MRLAVAILVVAGGRVVFLAIYQNDKPTISTQQNDSVQQQDDAIQPIDEPGNSIWIVNPTRPIPQEYIPSDLVVPNMAIKATSFETSQVRAIIQTDLEAMYQASVIAGYRLVLLSAYRSYATQDKLYSGYVKRFGQAEASRFSAKPGTSEHQTGLVVDLGRSDGNCDLESCFGDLPEGQWLAANAHRYGFIIRYLDGKEAITGYMYEPWHLRYVGKDIAKSLFDSGKTMEEYFGLAQ